MLVSYNDLKLYWEYASLDYPVVIIGMGRWGKVLASVIIDARNSTKNIFLVSRTNYSSTKQWVMDNYGISELMLTKNHIYAIDFFKNNNQLPLIIIASKPSQHYEDISTLIQYNLPIMVEKPIADKGEKALKIVRRYSNQTSYNLSVGIEFSLAPIFHSIYSQINRKIVSLFLMWDDPTNESRHGEVKRLHKEIHALDDIVYHALSIFKIFLNNSFSICLKDASIKKNGLSGSIEFIGNNTFCRVNVNQAAIKRQRLLIIYTDDGEKINIDFSEKKPGISGFRDHNRDNHICKQIDMNSNLRLEMGCLFYSLINNKESPLSANIKTIATLHKELNDLIG